MSLVANQLVIQLRQQWTVVNRGCSECHHGEFQPWAYSITLDVWSVTVRAGLLESTDSS